MNKRRFTILLTLLIFSVLSFLWAEDEDKLLVRCKDDANQIVFTFTNNELSQKKAEVKFDINFSNTTLFPIKEEKFEQEISLLPRYGTQIVYEYDVNAPSNTENEVDFSIDSDKQSEENPILIWPTLEPIGETQTFKIVVDDIGAKLSIEDARVAEASSYGPNIKAAFILTERDEPYKTVLNVDDMYKKTNYLKTFVSGLPAEKVYTRNVEKDHIHIYYETEMHAQNQTTKTISRDNDGDSVSWEWKIIKEKQEESNDHPDDNQDTPGFIPENILLSHLNSPIGVLSAGFCSYTGKILQDLGYQFALVDTDFSEDIVEKHPLLIVPSGALSSLHSSLIFKENLSNYILKGGTIIVFAQQRGSDFSVLPITLSAKGWGEDQSCAFESLQFETYHPTVASLNENKVSLYVDGFFESIPKTATPLALRTINGFPCMFYESYGKGRMIITSFYTDWGGQYQQVSKQGKLILRDLISWGQKQGEIPSFFVENLENLTVSLDISNTSSENVEYIRFKTYLPFDENQNKIEFFKNIEQQIAPGGSVTLSYSFEESLRNLGIWNIDADLLNANKEVITSYPMIGRFIFRKNLESQDIPDLQVTLTSDKGTYNFGEDALLQISLINNTFDEKSVFLSYYAQYHPVEGTQTVNIAPHSQESVFVTIPITTHNPFDRFNLNVKELLEEDSSDYLKGFFITQNVIPIQIKEMSFKSDKDLFEPSDLINLTLNGSYYGELSENLKARISVFEKSGKKLSEYPMELNQIFHSPLTKFNGTAQIENNFETKDLILELALIQKKSDDPLDEGIFIKKERISLKSNSYDYKVKDVFYQYENKALEAKIDILNDSSVPGPGYECKVEVKNQEGITIFTDQNSFEAIPGNTTQSFSLILPEIAENNENTLLILLEHKEVNKVLTFYKEVLFHRMIIQSNNKPVYEADEQVIFDADFFNFSPFSKTDTIRVDIPSVAYSQTSTIFLSPYETTSFPVSLSLDPEKAISGDKEIQIWFGDLSKTFMFHVPKAQLSLEHANVFSSSQGMDLTAKNNGKIWTDYSLNVRISKQEKLIFSEEQIERLNAGSTIIHHFSLPSLPTGSYILETELKNGTNLENSRVQRSEITIEGYTGTLNVYTDPIHFLPGQQVPIHSELKDVQGEVNGNIHIEIKKPESPSPVTSFELNTPLANYEEQDFAYAGGKVFYIHNSLEYPYLKQVIQINENGEHVPVSGLPEDPYHLYSDEDHKELWAVYYNNYIYRYNPANGEISAFYIQYSNNSIKKIVSNGVFAWVWISRNSSLYRLDLGSGQITLDSGWKNPAGYQGQPGTITGMTFCNNFFWVLRDYRVDYSTTYRNSISLHKYDPGTNTWTAYTGDNFINDYVTDYDYFSFSIRKYENEVIIPVTLKQSWTYLPAFIIKFNTETETQTNHILPSDYSYFESFEVLDTCAILAGYDGPYNKLLFIDLINESIDEVKLSGSYESDVWFPGKSIQAESFSKGTTPETVFIGFKNLHDSDNDLLNRNKYDKVLNAVYSYNRQTKILSKEKNTIEDGDIFGLNDVTIINPYGHGFYFYQNSNWKTEFFQPDDKNLFYYRQDSFSRNSIFRCSQNAIWFNDHIGVKRFDIQNKTFEGYTKDNSGLSSDNIMDITVKGSKVCFLGLSENEKIILDIYDEQQDKWASYIVEGVYESDYYNRFLYFIPDSTCELADSIWFTSYESLWGSISSLRLIKFDFSSSNSSIHYASDWNSEYINVTYNDDTDLDYVFAESANHISYAGDEGGIYLFNKESGTAFCLPHPSQAISFAKAGTCRITIKANQLWVTSGYPVLSDLRRYDFTNSTWTVFNPDNSILSGGAITEIYPFENETYFLEEIPVILESDSSYGGSYYQTLFRNGRVIKYNSTDNAWVEVLSIQRDLKAKFLDSDIFASYPDYQSEPGQNEEDLQFIVEKKNFITGDNQVTVADYPLSYDLTRYENVTVYNSDNGEDYYYLTIYGMNYRIKDVSSKACLLKGDNGFLFVSLQPEKSENLIIDIPVSTSSDVTYTSNLEPLNSPGRYEYSAFLQDQNANFISKDTGAFYIVDGNLFLSVETNKQIYKPNEPVVFNLTVKNIGTEFLSQIPLEFKANEEILVHTNIDLNGGDTYQTQVSTTHPENFSYYGKVNTFEIKGDITVSNPSLLMNVQITDKAGRDPFPTNVVLNNNGEVPLHLNLQIGTLPIVTGITLLPGETKIEEAYLQITQDQTIPITVTGDISLVQSFPVSFDEKISILLPLDQIYPEGDISFPISLYNEGSVISSPVVNLQVYSQGNIILEKSNSYVLEPSSNFHDSFNVTLSKGSYNIVCSWFGGTIEKSIEVLPSYDMSMDVNVGSFENGSYPIDVMFTNKGFFSFSGILEGDISQKNVVEEVNIESGLQKTIHLNFPVEFSEQSEELLKISLLKNQEILESETFKLTIPSTGFSLIDYPTESFEAGTRADYVLKVKNTGGKSGYLIFKLDMGEFQTFEKTMYLEAGEEQDIDCSFRIPSEIATGEYVASIFLNDKRTDIPFNLAGIDIEIQASLNKPFYSDGENIRLTIDIEDKNEIEDIDLKALVRYGNNEYVQSFNLSGTKQLSFEFPALDLSNNIFHVSVNHLNGESIFIKTFKVFIDKGGLILVADKNVYNPGEMVTIKAITELNSGLIEVNLRNIFSGIIDLSQEKQLSFSLPSDIVSHNYYIEYKYMDETKRCPIEVLGYRATIKGAKLNKEQYQGTDTLILTLQVDSFADAKDLIFHSEISATNDAIIYPVYQTFLNLKKGNNLLEIPIPLEVQSSGMHQLWIRLLKKTQIGKQICSSHDLTFDIGTINFYALYPLQQSFKTGEPIRIQTGFKGEGEGQILVHKDYEEDPIYTENITISGEQEYEIILPPIENIGEHDLKIVFNNNDLITERFLTILVTDGTPPVSNIAFSGIKLTKENINYIDDDTLIILYAKDNASGVNRIEYRLSDSGWNVYTSPFNRNVHGVFTLQVHAVDQNGNQEIDHSYQLFTDLIPPQTALESQVSDQTLRISLIANDSGSGVEFSYYKLNAAEAVQGNQLTISSPGIHTLEYWSKDYLGNEESHKTSTLILDITPPVTECSYQNPDKWNNSAVQVYFTASDDLSEVKATHFQINSGSIQTGKEVVIPDEGENTIIYWSEDLFGNTEEKKSVIIKIDKTEPDLNIFSPDESQTYIAGETVSIQYEASDSLSGLLKCQVFLNGDQEITGDHFQVDINDSFVLFKLEDHAGNLKEQIVNLDVKSNILEVGLVVKPETIMDNGRGTIVAFVWVPKGYYAKNIKTIQLDGVSPIKIIKKPWFLPFATVFFRVKDFSDLDVDFKVCGMFSDGVRFEGYDQVKKVIHKKKKRKPCKK